MRPVHHRPMVARRRTLDPEGRMRTGRSQGLRLATGIAVLGLAVHAGHGVTGAGGHAVDLAITRWLYVALVAGAAAVCLARAAHVRAERPAWALLGTGMAVYAGGELLWSAVYAGAADPPFPSLSDALYLA